MEAASQDPTVPRPASRRAVFDDRFFRTVLPERIQVVCPGHGMEVPVVLLDLADGRSLDLCHIDLLTSEWMAVSAFRENPSCADMDVVFVPYELIAVVTISSRSPGQRNVGFRMERDAGSDGHRPHPAAEAGGGS